MIDLHHIIFSIVIGIIEGITEFLPISSTGHMIIASHWLKIENNNTKILSMFMQLGSASAIFYFFHKKVLRILIIKNHFGEKNTKILHILLAVLPTIFLGVIFYNNIKLLFNIYHVMYALILGGIFLIISEMCKPSKYTISNMSNINLFQSMIIGLFQIFCLYPGVSRSGMTIAIGMLLGIKKSVAIEFSFIISIPLLMGASFFDIMQNVNLIKIIDLPMCFLGFAISFIVATCCIKKLLRIINNTSMIFFGIYRFILSVLIYFTH